MPHGVLPAEQLAKVPSTRTPVGIRVGAHQRVAARGAVDFHRRERGDAPREARIRSRVQPPASRCSCITATPCAACMNATACGCRSIQRLALFGLHADAAMTGPHQLAAEVFMVHADQAARGASRAPAGKYCTASQLAPNWRCCASTASAMSQSCRVDAARVEIARAGYEAVTPARDDVVAISFGDDECIVAFAARCS